MMSGNYRDGVSVLHRYTFFECELTAYTLECEDESVVQLREFFHTRGDYKSQNKFSLLGGTVSDWTFTSLGLESANDCVNSEFEDDWSAWKKNR